MISYPSEMIKPPPPGSRGGGRTPPTGPRNPQVERGSRLRTTRGEGSTVGTARSRLETAGSEGQNILSQRTSIHDFAKSIGDLNCSITSD